MCAVDYYGRRHGAFPALEEDFMFSFKKIQKNKFGKKIALFSLAVIFSAALRKSFSNIVHSPFQHCFQLLSRTRHAAEHCILRHV